MKNVMKVEIRRFLPYWIVLMTAYILFATISYTATDIEQVYNENTAIDFIVMLVIIGLTVIMLRDRIRPRKEFYYFSSISDSHLRSGRLLTILFFAIATSFLAILRFHLKLILTETPYYYGGPIIMIFVRIDNMFFGKTFLECLHPLNWILSMLFLSWIMFRTQDLMFLLHKKYLQSSWWQVVLSIIIGISTWASLLFLSKVLNNWLVLLDFNHWNSRVSYINVSDIEFNFLFLFSYTLILFATEVAARMLDSGKKNKYNRLG